MIDLRFSVQLNGMKRWKQSETDAMAEVLRRDGVISVVTDTVYGVCARADSPQAEERLRIVKNRPQTKSFPLMCADLQQLKTVAKTDERSEKVIRALMPGPLTVILPKRDEIPSYVSGGKDTVALRLACSQALYCLIRKTGCPIFLTSANQSGQPECRTLDEIEANCPLLDGMMEGEPSFGQASTIVDLTKEEPVILREGPVSMESIMEVLK